MKKHRIVSSLLKLDASKKRHFICSNPERKPMKLFPAVIILFAAVLAFGQAAAPNATPDPTSGPSGTDTESIDKAKEQQRYAIQLLDSAANDAGSLRLAQNRAIVLAMAGDLYWKYDEKRARTLFRNSMGEVLSANAEAEADAAAAARRISGPGFEGFGFGRNDGSDIRYQIISLAAKHDPVMALDMLRQTRPQKLAEAMAKAQGSSQTQQPGRGNFDPQSFQAQQEMALEQQLNMAAALDDPDKLAETIKDSIAKGISTNVLPLLQKLYTSDDKKALQLADTLVSKITGDDLVKQPQDINSVIGLLRAATSQSQPSSTTRSSLQITAAQPAAFATSDGAPAKQFSFTDPQLKAMANKLVDTFELPSNPPAVTAQMSRALTILQQIVPDKAALLQQKQAAAGSTSNTGGRGGAGLGAGRQGGLFDPNTTPESIIAQLPTMTDVQKTGAYAALTSKIAQLDDDSRAQRLIDQIPDTDARQRAQDQFQAAKASRATQSGNLDDAQRIIGTISQKNTQIQKLVALAIEFHNKGTDKDLEMSVSLMKQARGMVTQPFEDGDDLNDLLEVIKGYGVVDPDTAFSLFDSVVFEINDVVQASAVLSKYSRNDRSFKKGELVMRTNESRGDTLPIFRCISQIQMLGKIDIIRAGQIADKMARADTRTIIKLFAIQGLLGDGTALSTPTTGSRRSLRAGN